MAETAASQRASEKKAEEPKKKIFGLQKQPDLIKWRLIKTNDRTIRTDTPLYPPYIRFPNTDIIVWEEGTREIRWLPGEQSIFVDEQEKDGRKIPDNILNNPNNRFEIIDGDISARPHEKAKIKFLDMCNRNMDSEFRTGTVEGVFRRYTEEVRSAELAEKQEKQKEAMMKSFDATPEMILKQAPKLNISLIDHVTNGSRTMDVITTEYRQTAIDRPVEFLKIFSES